MLINAGALGTFNNVPDAIPVVAPGVYLLIITGQKIEQNKAQTGSNLVVDLEVAGGLNGAESPQKGRKLRRYFALPNNADDANKVQNKLTFIKQLFVASGTPIEPDGVNVDPAKLIGQKLNAEVKTVMNEGKEQNDLTLLRPEGSKF